MRGLAATVLPALAVVAAVFSLAAGHALMVEPRQRGALKTSFPFRTIDPTAPQDYWYVRHQAVRVAGGLDRAGVGGDGVCARGVRSGVSGANGGAWSLYDPLDPTLGPARANDHGACGDPAGANGDHMAGGKFYHGGKSVATYTAGSTIDFELAITAHHNGYMEWWVCDVDKCQDDDPTGACFATPGACVRLDRVPHPACEAGTASDCAYAGAAEAAAVASDTDASAAGSQAAAYPAEEDTPATAAGGAPSRPCAAAAGEELHGMGLLVCPQECARRG
ncbi:hypothetical protein MMPV_008408 [Pyropia vietnamensis]